MNSYFSELDLKKDAILANIGNNDKWSHLIIFSSKLPF